MKKENKILGVLGGLGPLATVYFMDMTVKMTDALKDQDHIPMIVVNDPTIPDRTDFILDKNKPNPLPKMIESAKILENAGADIIVMPCNTAHFFYSEIEKSVNIPMIHIIDSAVERAVKDAPRENPVKIGVLATKGTIISGAYRDVINKYDGIYIEPSEGDLRDLSDIIYNEVKSGKEPDVKKFLSIAENLRNRGADKVILGCTELSIIASDYNLCQEYPYFTDSLKALSEKAIAMCGKRVKNKI